MIPKRILLVIQLAVLSSVLGIYAEGPKAIVIGASSGIGKELSYTLLENGYIVGLVARSKNILDAMHEEFPNETFVKQIDISKQPEAMTALEQLIEQMNGVDLIVINAGISLASIDFEWEQQEQMIAVNVEGFAAMANVAMHHFIDQEAGHLVGISSIAAIRGAGFSPVYSASKAFVSNYLEGLRKNVYWRDLPITITDIQPGHVATPMINEASINNLPWVAQPEEAAQQIFDAIRKKKKHAYVTRRWRLIAWALKLMPDWLYNRL